MRNTLLGILEVMGNTLCGPNRNKNHKLRLLHKKGRSYKGADFNSVIGPYSQSVAPLACVRL